METEIDGESLIRKEGAPSTSGHAAAMLLGRQLDVSIRCAGATRSTPGTPGASAGAAARASGAAQREHTAIAARADNAV